jgi:hypothetical protein
MAGWNTANDISRHIPGLLKRVKCDAEAGMSMHAPTRNLAALYISSQARILKICVLVGMADAARAYAMAHGVTASKLKRYALDVHAIKDRYGLW